MEIRPVTLDEMPAVIAMYDQYERPVAQPPDIPRIEELYLQLAKANGCILGAFLDGALVGSCAFHLCVNFSWSGRPFAILENVIVSQSHRRQGIGRLLLTAARDRARVLDCYKVALMTGSAQPEVHDFYRAVGFKPGKTGYQIRFV